MVTNDIPGGRYVCGEWKDVTRLLLVVVSTSLNFESVDSLLLNASVVPSPPVGSVVTGGIGPLALLVLLLMLISVTHSLSRRTVGAGGLEVTSSELNSLATVEVSGRLVFMSVNVSGVGLKPGLGLVEGAIFVTRQVNS